MPKKFKYDLRPFVDAVRAFRAELQSHKDNLTELPIRNILRTLPTSFATPNDRVLLESRGAFQLSRKQSDNDKITVCSNSSGRLTSDVIDFKDDCLGIIRVKLPTVMNFELENLTSNRLEVRSTGEKVFVSEIERLSLPHLEKTEIFPFVLKRFVISDSRMISVFEDASSAEFVIDGGVPMGSAAAIGNFISDKYCYEVEVISYTLEYDNRPRCKAVKSTDDDKPSGYEVEKTFSGKDWGKAREWMQTNPLICTIID